MRKGMMDKVVMTLPFLLWVYAFRGFILGELAMIGDAPNYYRLMMDFQNQILRLVYPLWDPFQNLGKTANLSLRFLGEFNPFLLIPGLLHRLGLTSGLSHLIFLTSYYFVGLIGFYLLAKRIFQKRTMAFIAVVLLLFTSLGASFFSDFGIGSLFVPYVWFFYFLVAFAQQQEKPFFVGIVFSLMVIAVTYIPFYFVTIFLFFVLFALIFYFSQVRQFVLQGLRFMRTHKLLVCFCMIALCLSTVPGLMWYLEGAKGEFVAAHRQIHSTHSHSASMGLTTITAGGMIGPVTVKGLFSHLARANISARVFFFLPLFVYLLVPLTLFTKLNKRLLFLFCFGLSIFLVNITNASPIHGFLYEHVFYFKLIRNMHYLLYLMMPVMVLYVVEQLRLFLNYQPQGKRDQCVLLLFLLAIHGGFAFYLYQFGDIILTSYLTILLSFLFFILYFYRFFEKRPIALLAVLVVLLTLQPLEMAHHLSHNARAHPFTYDPRRGPSYPRFAYTRPTVAEFPKEKSKASSIQDKPGLTQEERYHGLYWTYFINRKLDQKILGNYVKNKFILYDRVALLGKPINFRSIEEAMRNNENVAFVPTPYDRMKEPPVTGDMGRHAQIIAGDSEQFRVLDFDLNEIKFKSNFPSGKFLVYNDSFHDNWQAFINGKKTRLYLANLAFKGLWLPAGENIVHLRFGPWGLHAFFLGILGLFYGIFIYLVWTWIKRLKQD